jgi:hypothetical protein
MLGGEGREMGAACVRIPFMPSFIGVRKEGWLEESILHYEIL